MTPQLMQAIKLLQLSNMDLVSYVEEELERNPLLERDEMGDAGPTEASENDAGTFEKNGSDGPSADMPEVDLSDAGDGAQTNHEEQDYSGPNGGEEADWVDTTLSSTSGDMEAVLDTSLVNVFPDEVPSNALDPDQLAGSTWSATGSGGSGYWCRAQFRGVPCCGNFAFRSSFRAIGVGIYGFQIPRDRSLFDRLFG